MRSIGQGVSNVFASCSTGEVGRGLQLQAQTQARFAVDTFANSGVLITDSLMIILGADMRNGSG
jgi:hypothetical protein